jgi:hypothetical protein
MEDVSILFVDSKNRDQVLYPSSNSYTLHLTTPIRNITRIDLVSAKIPNTTYNLTTTSNIVINSNVLANVSMLPGFYSTTSFCNEFNNSNQTTTRVNYSSAEGRFIFYNSNLNSLSTTGQLANIIGISSGSSFAASSNPAYVTSTIYAGMNLIKSSNVIDLSTNDYVWLDIDELRSQTTIDAKQIINMPLSNVVGDTPVTTTVTASVPATDYVNTTLTADVNPSDPDNISSVIFSLASVAGLSTGMEVLTDLVIGRVLITNINSLNVTIVFDPQVFPGTKIGKTFKAIKTTASIQLANMDGYTVGNKVVSPNLTGQVIITGISGSNVTIQYTAQSFPGLAVGSTFSAITGRTTSFQTYQGSTAATSFAMIHMDVPSGFVKTFKENSDYTVSTLYSTRIDKLSRLNIRWLDINGLPVAFNGLENNSFTLRIHSLRRVPEVDRPLTLPPPVEMGTGVPVKNKYIAAVSVAILIIGLLIITFLKKRRE